MVDYIEKILVPYIRKIKVEKGYDISVPSLVICDVFAAHRTAEVRKCLDENNIRVVYIPAGCTGECFTISTYDHNEVSVNQQKTCQKQPTNNSETTRIYAHCYGYPFYSNTL